MKREEEQLLIHSLKTGSNQAYKYIYDNHYVLLCKIAYEYLKDDFLAETIVDDTIFHLWEIRDTIDITSLRSYLVQAIRNRCINHLKLEREKREINFSVLDKQNDWLESSFKSTDHPLGTLLEKELEQVINKAIEQLPTESRNVFKMSRFEDKRYEEIASELNISINTVKYHIKNALTILHANLSNYLYFLILLFYNQ